MGVKKFKLIFGSRRRLRRAHKNMIAVTPRGDVRYGMGQRKDSALPHLEEVEAGKESYEYGSEIAAERF